MSPDGLAPLSIALHSDGRGTLAVFDTLPFVPKRIFAIFDVPAGATRGGHALSCDEYLWAAAGGCRVDLDDGKRVSSTLLNDPRRAVLVEAGVKVTLADFLPHTLVMVFAPRLYSEIERFAAPQPDLIAARTSVHDSPG